MDVYGGLTAMHRVQMGLLMLICATLTASVEEKGLVDLDRGLQIILTHGLHSSAPVCLADCTGRHSGRSKVTA